MTHDIQDPDFNDINTRVVKVPLLSRVTETLDVNWYLRNNGVEDFSYTPKIMKRGEEITEGRRKFYIRCKEVSLSSGNNRLGKDTYCRTERSRDVLGLEE